MEDLISIIVPVYNVEQYLDKCLDSLTNQTYKNLEIILIDDGSTDSSGKKCDEWKQKDTRITVIHKQNSGVSSARNMGLNKSTGTYVIFIDSDDYCDIKMIEKLYFLIKKYNSEMAICSFYYLYDNYLKEAKKLKNLLKMNKTTFLDNINQDYYKGYLWNKLLKKELLKNLQFDENKYICEDMFFVINYLENCNNIIYTDQSLYYYRQNNNSVMHNMNLNKVYHHVKSLDEIITLIKERYHSKIYYSLEVENIYIASNLKYYIKKNNKNDERIIFINNTIRKYIKDGCIKKEKRLIQKIKIIFCVYFNNLYIFIKSLYLKINKIRRIK